MHRFPDYPIKPIYALMQAVLRFVYPSVCHTCSLELQSHHDALCVDCWVRIRNVGSLTCSCCMNELNPLGREAVAADMTPERQNVTERQSLCYPCQKVRPAFHAVRGLWIYDDQTVRQLLLGFKYADHTNLANFFATQLWGRFQDYIQSNHVLVPVPLHPLRFWYRMYNQSSLLAHAIAKRTDRPVIDTVLERQKRTPPLGKLSSNARHRILRGAFTVNPQRRDDIRGQTILLVDDVMTTGRTLDICARTLLRAGADRVNALVVARNALSVQF